MIFDDAFETFEKQSVVVGYYDTRLVHSCVSSETLLRKAVESNVEERLNAQRPFFCARAQSLVSRHMSANVLRYREIWLMSGTVANTGLASAKSNPESIIAASIVSRRLPMQSNGTSANADIRSVKNAAKHEYAGVP
jgi:hypothetical protein